MIKIYKPNKNYFACLICGKKQTDSQDIFAIELIDSYKQGICYHFCKDHCKELSGLLKLTQYKDFKMASIDNID